MCGTQRTMAERRGEHGGARLKFIIILALIAAVSYIGYLYIPVAYNAYLFKDVMQSKVDKAAADGKAHEWVEKELASAAPEYGVPPPPASTIKAEKREGRMEATVQFIHPIEFPGYTYQYNFNHTVKSSDLFVVK